MKALGLLFEIYVFSFCLIVPFSVAEFFDPPFDPPFLILKIIGMAGLMVGFFILHLVIFVHFLIARECEFDSKTQKFKPQDKT